MHYSFELILKYVFESLHLPFHYLGIASYIRNLEGVCKALKNIIVASLYDEAVLVSQNYSKKPINPKCFQQIAMEFF